MIHDTSNVSLGTTFALLKIQRVQSSFLETSNLVQVKVQYLGYGYSCWVSIKMLKCKALQPMWVRGASQGCPGLSKLLELARRSGHEPGRWRGSG